MKMKCFAVLGLMLFLGVAVAPSINALYTEENNSRVQLLGIDGIYSDSKHLSDEQQKALDIIFTETQALLNDTSSEYQKTRIYNNCIQSLRNENIISHRQKNYLDVLLRLSQLKILPLVRMMGEVTYFQLIPPSIDLNSHTHIFSLLRHPLRQMLPIKFGWNIGIGEVKYSHHYYYYYENYHPSSGWIDIQGSSMLSGDIIYGDIGYIKCNYNPDGIYMVLFCIGIELFSGISFYGTTESVKFLGISLEASIVKFYPFTIP